MSDYSILKDPVTGNPVWQTDDPEQAETAAMFNKFVETGELPLDVTEPIMSNGPCDSSLRLPHKNAMRIPLAPLDKRHTQPRTLPTDHCNKMESQPIPTPTSDDFIIRPLTPWRIRQLLGQYRT